MVSPRQHRKAKLIYNVGVEPPHRCDTRCYDTAARLAAADECKKCESRYELLYYNGQHVVNRLHQPTCPDRDAHRYAKNVLAVVDGQVIARETDVETIFKCPHGCQAWPEHGPEGAALRHERDCPEWSGSDEPLQPR